MTSGNMPTRVAMPCPFADTGDVASIGDTTGNTINFPDGFPEVYSTPPSANGKLVQRNEVNALGKIATQNQFYYQCGGINTFDATFASKIGGYPKGAVLKYLNGDNIYEVISLVDGNEVDFTSVGVDGVNWRFLNVPYDTPSNEIVLSSFNVGPFETSIQMFSTYSYTSGFYSHLGYVRVPKTGILYVNNPSVYAAQGQGTANLVNTSQPSILSVDGSAIIACKVPNTNTIVPPSFTSIGDWFALSIIDSQQVRSMTQSYNTAPVIHWDLNTVSLRSVQSGEIYAIGVIYGATGGRFEQINTNKFNILLWQGILCGSPSDTSSKISFNVSLLT